MSKATKKALANEGKLVADLCQKHGYTLMANKPGNRTTMVMSTKVVRGRKTREIKPFYLMQLAVPMDSELGRQMLEQFPLKKEKVDGEGVQGRGARARPQRRR